MTISHQKKAAKIAIAMVDTVPFLVFQVDQVGFFDPWGMGKLRPYMQMAQDRWEDARCAGINV